MVNKKQHSNTISVTSMTIVKSWYHIYLRFFFCYSAKSSSGWDVIGLTVTSYCQIGIRDLQDG